VKNQVPGACYDDDDTLVDSLCVRFAISHVLIPYPTKKQPSGREWGCTMHPQRDGKIASKLFRGIKTPSVYSPSLHESKHPYFTIGVVLEHYIPTRKRALLLCLGEEWSSATGNSRTPLCSTAIATRSAKDVQRTWSPLFLHTSEIRFGLVNVCGTRNEALSMHTNLNVTMVAWASDQVTF